MTSSPRRGIMLAVGTAVAMHLLLFAVALPSNSRRMKAVQIPPVTHYTMQSVDENTDEGMVRMIKSPVLFALPTDVGFSRELLENDVQTSKTLLQQFTHSEAFLTLNPDAGNAADQLHPGTLMISSAARSLGLPVEWTAGEAPVTTPQRVSLDPDLRERLVGGIILPPELNQTAEHPWSVRASLDISEQGSVDHVFLDRPLESASLNQQVLRLLYGLRFKPGDATTGSIEIYSPEADGEGEE